MVLREDRGQGERGGRRRAEETGQDSKRVEGSIRCSEEGAKRKKGGEKQ